MPDRSALLVAVILAGMFLFIVVEVKTHPRPEEYCDAGSGCGCPRYICTQFRATAADDGRSIRMAVGEWISLELPDVSGPAAASTSDPMVVSLYGKPRSEFVNYQKVLASFHALRSGSARLTIGYLNCPDSTHPCWYSVDVEAVQFPKAKVTVDNVNEQNSVRLRVGQVARFEAPYPNCVRYGAASCPVPWNVSIDSPNVIEWAVEPIYPISLLEAAIVARSPGTAHVQASTCTDADPQCASPWRLTFVVA